VTTGEPAQADDPGRQRWTWDQQILPRWLLVGHTGTPQFADEDALALCADIDGLFVDLPPRPREWFTLLGCVPDGVLASILDSLTLDTAGTGRAWLGNLWVSARPDDSATQRGWFGVGLLDVTVLDHQPSGISPGCVDVELEGLVDRTDTVYHPGDLTGFVLSGPDDARCGVCADVTGVFEDPAERLVPHVTLVGCRPEPPLLAAIAAVPQSTKAGLRRRRVSAAVKAIAADGSAVPLLDVFVAGTLISSVPSGLGDGLLDVTIDSDVCDPPPAGTRDILDLWFTGGPTERNLWAGYDRALRRAWALVAFAYHRDIPDRLAGTVFDLDGRFVTDIEGFYCAIGEAINGPGGYFGSNLDDLDECLRHGNCGAQIPFHLIWHDSAVAREHLVAGYDRHRYAPTITLDDLLQIFAEYNVEVELR